MLLEIEAGLGRYGRGECELLPVLLGCYKEVEGEGRMLKKFGAFGVIPLATAFPCLSEAFH